MEKLNHNGVKEIETERLILRKFTLDDAEMMFDNWASDDEVAKHLTWPAHESIEFTKELLGKWVEDYKKPDYYEWAIVRKEDNIVLGSLGIHFISERDMRGEAGYCISKDCWGKGYVPEALRGVIKFCFEEVGFNRIEGYHSIENPSSGRVMQKCGMTKEGTIRKMFKTKAGGFVDMDVYGILKDEFK